MNSIANMSEWLYITFKFGGYWAKVKNKDRRRYEGGKQLTVKFQKDFINLFVLKEKVEEICPWLKGHEFNLHYHIFDTSPKEYLLIEGDVVTVKMIEEYDNFGRVEIVVTTEENTQNDLDPHGMEQREPRFNSRDYLEAHHSNPSNIESTHLELGIPSVESLMGQLTEEKALAIGARFYDCMSFKHALRTTAITENYGVKIKASDKTRVIAICSHRNCPWRIRASLCPDGQSFEVRKFNSTHLCPGINRAGNKLATATWVAQEIQDIVKNQPNIPPQQIKNNLEMSYGLSLPYMKLWRSREQARNILFGEVDDNYRWVPTLRAELVNRNPGSHIIYSFDSTDFSFQRFYVSFKACVDGFMVGCRYLVGIDACHLKSKYLGVLLSANALDGNNGLFNIAFAVVESESKKSHAEE